MPGELSTAGANIALDAVTGRAAAAQRTTYLALLTAAPTDATTPATMTELSATGYSRQALAAAAWNAPSGDPASTSNSGTITFGSFSTDPANVTHCALVSSASGTTGDFLMHWQLTAAKDAAIGESIQFAAGALVMTLD